jgi:hypothetical protein
LNNFRKTKRKRSYKKTIVRNRSVKSIKERLESPGRQEVEKTCHQWEEEEEKLSIESTPTSNHVTQSSWETCSDEEEETPFTPKNDEVYHLSRKRFGTFIQGFKYNLKIFHHSSLLSNIMLSCPVNIVLGGIQSGLANLSETVPFRSTREIRWKRIVFCLFL